MHFGIFVIFIVVAYATIMGHFVNAKRVNLASRIWFGFFTFQTVGIVICGRIAVGGYDFTAETGCPSTLRGDHGLLKRLDGSPLWPDTAGDARCLQTPTVPWGLMAFLDFGWFALLCITTLFLPHAATIRFNYKLVHPETKRALRKFKAAGMLQGAFLRGRARAQPHSESRGSRSAPITVGMRTGATARPEFSRVGTQKV